MADRLVLGAALLVFIVYAANFLYYFVDDEGIPLVFARNLLRGRGLSYNSFEGPVEGYTDFLHVLTSAVTLSIVQAIGAPVLSVFFIGKAISFLAGIGTVAMTWQTVRRTSGVTPVAALAGLLLLATAGPVAVWACSSLETATFVFLLSALLFALHVGARLDTLAALLASAVVLERLDGPLYVGAVLGAYYLSADATRRRRLVTRVGAPLLVVLVAYHGWRLWYFGEWLNMPFYTKIAYKLWPDADLVTKSPAMPQWARFVDMYGVPLLALLGLTLLFGLRDRRVRPVVLAAAVALAYASFAGDWMFGLRMFAAALPWLAVAVILSLSLLETRWPLLGALLGVAIIALSADRARSFEADYERVTRKPSFVRHPGIDLQDYFGSYYNLVEVAASRIPPGTRVAYNQGGLVPFLLDLDNIDDLGLCSKFYAKLPTTDVFFTEVGRYVPLREGPVIGATEAYLLYHDVQFIIQRNQLLRPANDGRVPPALLGGYFVRDAGSTLDTIYRRGDRDASQFKRDPSLFTENLAHTSRVSHASLNGMPLDHRQASLRFLGGDESRLLVDQIARVDVTFAETDERVFAVGVNRVTANGPARLLIELRSKADIVVFSTIVDLPKGESRSVASRLPLSVMASRLRVTVTSDARARLWIEDLRVLGQTSVLADYVRRALTLY